VICCLGLSPEENTTLQEAAKGKSWEAMIKGMERLIVKELAAK